MDVFLQTLIYGIATGSVIAVAAVGLTLSFGVTGFINFSYGEVLTLGAYTTYLLVQAGLGILAAGAGAVVVGGLVTYVVARLFFEPLRQRGSMALLITSIGVAFVLQNVIQMLVGGSPKPFPLPLLQPWELGGVFVPKLQAIVFGLAAVCMLAIHLMLRYTMLGRTMRAAASNDDLARVSGLDTRRIIGRTWLVSGLVAGLGGALLGASQGQLSPTMGFQFLLLVFAAAMLGGIGKPYGAMLGALVIGVGVEFAATYVSANYSEALAFLVLILVLLLRPRGFLGSPNLAHAGAAS
jgi:branched-subunit amino acid ABC-type transport system permease component